MDRDIECLLFRRSKTKQSLKVTKTVIAKNKASNCAFIAFLYSPGPSRKS